MQVGLTESVSRNMRALSYIPPYRGSCRVKLRFTNICLLASQMLQDRHSRQQQALYHRQQRRHPKVTLASLSSCSV